MRQDKIVKTDEIFTQAGKLRYWLLDAGGLEPYGIAVSSETEIAVQHHLTANEGCAQAWYKRLVSGEVRPCHLYDVILNLLIE